MVQDNATSDVRTSPHVSPSPYAPTLDASNSSGLDAPLDAPLEATLDATLDANDTFVTYDANGGVVGGGFDAASNASRYAYNVSALNYDVISEEEYRDTHFIQWINRSFNATRRDQIEPLPQWNIAIPEWGEGVWGFHTIGFGSLFVILDLFLIFTVLRLRKRACAQPLLVLVAGIVFVMAGLRATYLIMDPYTSRQRFPLCVARLTYGLAFPCLTAGFCAMQILLLRVTRVKGPPPSCSKYQTVLCVMFAHFGLVVLVEVIVCGNPSLKLLVLMTQAFFITWGLVLCFGFIYNGFKLAQFTNETKRALEQLAAYSKARREILRDGNRRDLALHRMSKPKIRSEEEERHGLSDYGNQSNSSDLAGSSDSLSFFNEAHLVFDEQAIEQAYKAAFPRLKRPLCCDRENNNYNNHIKLHLTATTSNYDLSSETEYVTDTPVTPQQPCDAQNSPQPAQTSSSEQHTYYNPGYTELRSTKSTSSFVFRNKCFSPCNGYVQVDGPTNQHSTENTLMESDPKVGLESEFDISQCYEESGYTADTEFYSPLPTKKSTKNDKKAKSKTTKETNATNAGSKTVKDPAQPAQPQPPASPSHDLASSPTRQPYALPENKGALGLYRIRQGQVLRRVLHVTYGSALLGFVACVLHLYAMFGVYGVLSNETVAEPWSWFCFQTATRLVELGIGYTLAYSIFLLGCTRYRRSHRKRRQTTLNQTVC